VSNPVDRPGLAMIANCMTPYRANLHALIAAAIPELKLHTLITHGPADFDWSVNVPESIHASYLGGPDDSPTASPLHAPLREWRKGGQLIEYLREHQVRAVICMGYRYLSYLRVIGHCHRHHVPLFSRNDSNIKSEVRLSPFKQFVKKWVYAWWMPRVAGVMSMGEYGDQFFLKYGAVPSRIYRVPYTPDYDLYARVDPVRLDQLCRQFGLCEGRRYVLYSGRLVAAKRVDLLIEAFAAIAGQRPEWDLLIVGDGVLRDNLGQLVPEELRQRVVWTGFLENSELVAAYHAADVLVLPSDFEPWALVIQEAMAAGLAVVASDVVGAARELVEDKVSGRIFPAGDVEALRQAMLDVTDGASIAAYQRQAPVALAEWRRRVDPVAEVRRALVDCGVLAADVPSPRNMCEAKV
jgi:glycosyltransferase involved in cell wall biosynthesis